ncbi:MAG TPA: hypothetical protein PKW33_08895 [Anaerolineaceae bacterium]|nr:hypothetical protein [Anaerolineaceae bacterium]HPN51691.1 hypothetical protein [Anaerolineaceae bacterium]
MEQKLVIRDNPIFLWIFGLGFLAAGVFVFFQKPLETWLPAAFLGLFGVLMTFLPSALTITADRSVRTLTLRYGIIVTRSLKTIPFDAIQTIYVTSHHSHSSRGGHSTSYRIELVQRDGTVVPFRSYYSSGSFFMERNARKLREFIGLEESVDQTPLGILRAAPSLAQPQLQRQQEMITGANAAIHETNGVKWQLQVIPMGTSPVVRWYSQSFATPGTFLFIAQKVQGQPSGFGGNGLMASIGKTLFRQTLAMYGFSGADLPDIETAAIFGPLEGALEQNFVAFTDEPYSARQLLNPWVQMPLVNWAQRYPLKQIHSGRFSQLSVMFCPTGTYVSVPGTLDQSQVDELAVLGSDLVRAVAPSPSAR